MNNFINKNNGILRGSSIKMKTENRNNFFPHAYIKIQYQDVLLPIQRFNRYALLFSPLTRYLLIILSEGPEFLLNLNLNQNNETKSNT